MLGTVNRRPPEVARRRRALDRIGLSPWVGPVFDHHPIRRPRAGGFEPHLRIHRVPAEEGEVHADPSRGLRRVEHLLGPVLAVTNRQKRLVIPQLRPVGVGVDIR